MTNHKTEDEDELKETGETNSTIWVPIYQNRAEMKTALGSGVTGQRRKREDGVIERRPG